MTNELKGVIEDNSFNVIVQITESGPRGPQGPSGIDGKSLEFHWNGTQLGVRVEGQTDYQYVDLKGPQGERGPQGPKGDAGPPGTTTWDGITDKPTNLETVEGSQAKANQAEQNAKAYTDVHEQKAAPHSGHETPAGAQAKADAAEASAKSYADNIGTALSGIIGSLGSLLTTVKTNIVAAINSLKSELDAHKADNMPHLMLVDNKVYKYGFKQENGFVKFLYEEVM